MGERSVKNYFYILLILIGVFGVWGVIYATAWGPGLLDWDSFNYISAARNLAAGKGLVIPADPVSNNPMVHYPPLFPILLAGFEALSVDAMTAARWLNAFLFGLTAVLLGLTVDKVTQSQGFGLLSAGLFVLAEKMVVVYAYALSEPLLLALTVLSIWYLGKYLEEEKTQDLYLASLMAAGAFLTKYGGAANVIAVSISLIFVGSKGLRTRVGRAATAGVIGVLPGVLWTWRNYALTGSFNNRDLAAYVLEKKQFVFAYFTVYGWFAPFKILDWNESLIFLLSILAAGAVLGALAYDGYRAEGEFRLGALLRSIHPIAISYALFGLCFAGVVFTSKSFVDPAISLDSRMLAPLFPSLIVLLMVTAAALLSGNGVWRKGLAGLAMIYLIVFSLVGFVGEVPHIHNTGLGLNRKGVLQAESINTLIELSGQEMIYSDYPAGMYLLTGGTGYRFAQLTGNVIPPEGVVFASFRAIGYGQDYIDHYRDDLTLVVKDKIAEVYWYTPP